MRVGLVLGAAIGLGLLAPQRAHADAFVFKDHDGFEKCMNLDHLVETVKTDKGEQSRFLQPDEIQPRCVEAGVKLVAGAKNKDLGMQLVATTKRLASPRLALDLVGATIDIAVAQCNEMAIYEVLMGPLGDFEDGSADLKKTRPIIKRCLKDKTFAKDFMDEKDSEDAHRAAHACQILVEEKLVKTCKGAK